MAKNIRKQQREVVSTAGSGARGSPILSRRGKKVMGLGAAIVALGFWVLTYTDPAGQNWASTVSPLLLVMGYSAIGVGIVLCDPQTPTE
jgi:hypothetical protein